MPASAPGRLYCSLGGSAPSATEIEDTDRPLIPGAIWAEPKVGMWSAGPAAE
jgi:hypothetical protein